MDGRGHWRLAHKGGGLRAGILHVSLSYQTGLGFPLQLTQSLTDDLKVA